VPADDADAVMRRTAWESTPGEDLSARDRGFLLAVRHP
jgi:hypothetical protein